MRTLIKCIILGLFIPILLISGCKKEKVNDSNMQYYRLVELLTLVNSDSALKTEYKYQGDKISEIITYTPNKNNASWEKSNKSEFSYPDENTFENVFFNYDNGEWQESATEITTHQNGLLQSIKKYSKSGVLTNKTDFTYDGDKILKQKSYIKSQDGMLCVREYIFTWIGMTPSTAEYRFYGENSYDSSIFKDTLTLSNNKIVKVEGKLYFLDTIFLVKDLIQYEGDKVISIVEYYQDSVNWVENDSHLFDYDENGNLTKHTSGSTSIIYTYETGKGNLDLIYNKQSDFFYFYHPLPVTSATGKEVMKNILMNRKVPLR